MFAADRDKETLQDSVKYASLLVSRTDGLWAIVHLALNCGAFVERKKDRYLTEVIPNFFFGRIAKGSRFGVYDADELSNLEKLSAKLEKMGGTKNFLAALSYCHLQALNQPEYHQAINEIRNGHLTSHDPSEASRKAHDCICTLTNIFGNCCPQDLLALKEEAIRQTNTAYYLLFVEEWASGKRTRNLNSLHELHSLMVDGELRAQLANKIIQMETGPMSEEETKFAPELYTLKKAV